MKLGSFSQRRWKEGIRRVDTPRKACAGGRRKAHPSRSYTRELSLPLRKPGSGKENKRKHSTCFVLLAGLLDQGVNLVPCTFPAQTQSKEECPDKEVDLFWCKKSLSLSNSIALPLPYSFHCHTVKQLSFGGAVRAGTLGLGLCHYRYRSMSVDRVERQMLQPWLRLLIRPEWHPVVKPALNR